MKPNQLFLLLAFFINFNMLIAQTSEIEIVEKLNGTIVTLQVKNSSIDASYFVKLTINSKGYKITEVPPYEVSVAPGEIKDVITMVPKLGETQGYDVSLSAQTINGEAKYKPLDVIPLPKDTLLVFTMPNCSRSKNVLDMLTKSGKLYKECSLSDEKDGQMFWSNYNKKGTSSSSVTTPIIYKDGAFISDYSTILAKLK